MVAKMIALYKHPPDQKAFDDKYFNQHVPLVQKMPGLQLLEISKVNGAPFGEPAFYMMVELYFDDIAAARASLDSPEGKAASENIMSFAGDLVTLLFAEVHDKN